MDSASNDGEMIIKAKREKVEAKREKVEAKREKVEVEREKVKALLEMDDDERTNAYRDSAYKQWRGISRDALNDEKKQLNDEKKQLSAEIDRMGEELHDLRVSAPGSDSVDYKQWPFFYDSLKSMGLQTPWEQYTLYGAIGIFLYGSYAPFRKAHFLHKWLHESDPCLKDIWAARANLSAAEQNGGERYLQELKRVPRRYAFIPLSYLVVEGVLTGYRKFSGVFR